MSTLAVVVTAGTSLAVVASGVVDLAAAPFVLANSAEVGVPRSALPALAALKIAGGAGLVVGLLGLRPIGTAAAVGLVAFFVGAVVVHVRAGVLHNIAFPGTFLAAAAATLALALPG
jgi:DoxX-like protein